MTVGEMSLDGVVMAFDEAYAKHGACTICSLLDVSAEDFGTLTVVSVGLGNNTKRKISYIASRYGKSVDYVELSEEAIEREGLSLETYGEVEVDYVTPATYARLLLDKLLVPTDGRYLYLDADTIVTGRVTKLAEVELPWGIGAVNDPGVLSLLDREGIQCPELLPGLANGPYFNAGVLLFDLNTLRSTGFFGRARTYARKARGRMLLYDQEALNAAAMGRYTEIGEKWNYMTHGAAEHTNRGERDVSIRHFCSHTKPWDDSAYDDDAYLYTERADELRAWGW